MKGILAFITIVLFSSFILFAFYKADQRYESEQNELDSLRKEVKILRKLL